MSGSAILRLDQFAGDFNAFVCSELCFIGSNFPTGLSRSVGVFELSVLLELAHEL